MDKVVFLFLAILFAYRNRNVRATETEIDFCAEKKSDKTKKKYEFKSDYNKPMIDIYRYTYICTLFILLNI